ncbi:hypothetical protein AKJ66_02545 [candidate division MSBL1 archaeon SCGC-AAA259E22]|uniref:Branched-chain amino acid ABC transporter permease n=1 Tax=candidate division MSBL1 archaeon SCGC-AAA259E22 TaxID=1698265 RepID=A0A133UGF3_9EURY|nr:hypothetical protein AKJ66_02545 [candidate division MSBL1 archaeon SCGC-AAA259E22]
MNSFEKTVGLIRRLSGEFRSSLRTPKGLIIIGALIFFFVMPLFAPSTYLWVFGLTFPFVIMVVSWDLLVGYSGQLNLGHSVFVGVGGYTGALLFAQERFSVYQATAWIPNVLPDIPIPILIIIGGIASAIIGLVIGVICLRLRGFYLGLVTAVLPLIFVQLTGVWAALLGSYEGFSLGLEASLHPTLTGSYYFSLIAMVLCLAIMLGIIKSRWGLIFESIRDNENLARSAGINTLKYKLLAFTTSAFFAGVAGGLFVFFRHFVGIDLANVPLVLLIILGAVLGGSGTFYGPVIGGFLVYLLKMLFLGDVVEFLPIDVEPETLLFFLLVILILTFPEGIYHKIQSMVGET